MKRSKFIALAAALASLIPATGAHADEYFLSHFTSAAETALDGGSAWQYNNTDKANWISGWDGNSSLTFDFDAPIAPGENHRLRAPLPSPAPSFNDYPYTKVKVTFSGIPDGDTVLFQIRQELSSGYIKRTWPVSNGTHVLTLDGTDIPSFDGGSNDPFDPASPYFRIRLQIDLTTIPTWVTASENVQASIDYVVITDDPSYGEDADGEGEGAAEGEGEGDGGNNGGIAAYYTRQLGDDITISVPNPGTATVFTWTFKPASGGNTQVLAETSGILHLTDLTHGDAGIYTATYDNGAKAPATYSVSLNIVNQLPASSSVTLVALAAALGSIGILRASRLRRT